MTDPIADFLTRLRNAISAKHRVVEVPASNLKKEITKILFDKGYILNYKFVEDGPQGTIKVALKYDAVNKVNAIKKLERVSTPGMRKYTGYSIIKVKLAGSILLIQWPDTFQVTFSLTGLSLIFLQLRTYLIGLARYWS